MKSSVALHSDLISLSDKVFPGVNELHQHYQEKLTLDQIAASAMVSTRECLRCFQLCIQKTPFAYLLDHRVQMAETLLRTTNVPITEIALETGFSNSAYFFKVFKEMRSISPSQYRKRYLFCEK